MHTTQYSLEVVLLFIGAMLHSSQVPHPTWRQPMALTQEQIEKIATLFKAEDLSYVKQGSGTCRSTYRQ